MHALIREAIHHPDPYHRIKLKYNRLMMDQYEKFDKLVKRSEDPFNMAMRLAIAGNVIDFGSQLQPEIMETIDRVMDEKPAIDHSSQLRLDLEQADSLLYIGDNAPGAVWASTSEQFQRVFSEADVIIAKGQGNLEGLQDVAHDRLYFLLVTKCALVAERVGSKKEEFIVKKLMS